MILGWQKYVSGRKISIAEQRFICELETSTGSPLMNFYRWVDRQYLASLGDLQFVMMGEINAWMFGWDGMG